MSKSLPPGDNSQLLHPQRKLGSELGISTTTLWRWTRDGLIPPPDVEVNSRKYYSATRREEVIAAVFGSTA